MKDKVNYLYINQFQFFYFRVHELFSSLTVVILDLHVSRVVVDWGGVWYLRCSITSRGLDKFTQFETYYNYYL